MQAGLERRERKRAARSAAVLDAAMAIVVREGIAMLSMGKVAAALDVAVGGLYRYFPSKETIVLALQQRAIADFGARLQRHLATPSASPLAAAVAPFWFYVSNRERDPQGHRLIDAFLSSPVPTLELEHVLELEPALETILSACDARLYAAAEVGALRDGDPRERTLALWGSLHGIGHLRHRERVQPARYAVEPLSRAVVHGLFVGWGADPEAVARAIPPATSG